MASAVSVKPRHIFRQGYILILLVFPLFPGRREAGQLPVETVGGQSKGEAGGEQQE